MTMTHSRKALVVSLLWLLHGCMVGPDYHKPQVSMPADFKETPGWSKAQPGDAVPKGEWWAVFDDPLLNELEPMVSVSNQTVRQSYENYQAALADVQVARSGLFPTIGITGSATRQRTGSNGVGNTVSVSPGIRSSGSLEGSVSWAPDLWGKVRRGVEENTATAEADAASLANATLTAQVALATAVIDLRVTDANIDLLTRTVNDYKEYLRVIGNQDAAGIIPPSDLISARTQLENAQSSLIALGVSRAKYEHAIAVLVGKTPEELNIPHSDKLPTLPTVPAGVPSTLLQRRPDIAVAERQMAAQNAAIGVAIAAYYPDITLSGADGFSQSPLAGLLHVANHVWSLGADVSETIFDAGARHGQVAAARATYEAAVANYRGTVLTALQDVEDDLAGLRILAQQAEVLDSAVRDATRGSEIAFNEYKAGTVDYTTALTAQTTLVSTQQSALSVQQQRLLDAVSLIGDLGGSATQPAPPASATSSP
ncbi:NodT family efflux transporter outer membrane factor (OMF) lipoprotein [Luteibacter sp. Sphag1AF]|uniref:efflux transporter outer membrane subunit n=1 Tax=Luteibacter sp. Sphag1AF TaxID=2587031 RepID=UPI001613CC3D|nr:efflux transporter outer membrane subunit [Luteibacter sp. Sphag1AF]MBB3228101.1 NodT family efflux transporter outer membrane factor (OMF) lipoprotein [Luteibacter sp. Sphag1AF]